MSNEESLHTALKSSAEFKDEGNAFFLEKNWTSALTAYNQALACLPSLPVVETIKDSTEVDAKEPADDLAERQPGNDEAAGSSTQEPTKPVNTPLEDAYSHARVILHSNIAACELKLVSNGTPTDVH